jgi:hypothetical protein
MRAMRASMKGEGEDSKRKVDGAWWRRRGGGGKQSLRKGA